MNQEATTFPKTMAIHSAKFTGTAFGATPDERGSASRRKMGGQIGIGGILTDSTLPHHRTSGSAYGDSAD